mgnify:CR=1 FL=1
MAQICDGMEERMREYWRFRAKSTLEKVTLHLRRRARFYQVFAFMKWRINALRHRIMILETPKTVSQAELGAEVVDVQITGEYMDDGSVRVSTQQHETNRCYTDIASESHALQTMSLRFENDPNL